MRHPRTFVITALFVLVAVCTFAQQPVQTSPPIQQPLPERVPRPRRPIVERRKARPRPETCWQEAGISKAAMQERRNVQRENRAQIESVCANSSLSVQQRRQEIRAIRERTHQQLEGLISPQQRAALKACEEARGGGGHGGGGFHGGGGGRERGPCGELMERREEGNEREPEP